MFSYLMVRLSTTKRMRSKRLLWRLEAKNEWILKTSTWLKSFLSILDLPSNWLAFGLMKWSQRKANKLSDTSTIKLKVDTCSLFKELQRRFVRWAQRWILKIAIIQIFYEFNAWIEIQFRQSQLEQVVPSVKDLTSRLHGGCWLEIHSLVTSYQICAVFI